MMLQNKPRLLSALLLLSAVWTGAGYGQTAEEKGLEIAKERKQRDEGWGDSVAQMSMVLRNAQGQSTEQMVPM